MKTPLNGTKTHPLTPFAIGVLEQIAREPIPMNEVNPGVRDRLLREDLVAVVLLPSPYKKDKGGSCKHFQITPRGRKALGFQNSARKGIDMAT